MAPAMGPLANSRVSARTGVDQLFMCIIIPTNMTWPGYTTPHVLLGIATFVQKLKTRHLELLKLQCGERVLDVGCGPGADLIEMREHVAPGGAVIGVDRDPAMVQRAASVGRAFDSSRGPFVAIGDASYLPYLEETFDACRCERVLQHVATPQKVVAEIMRILKTGGRVVASDTDWSTLSIDSSQDHVERSVVSAIRTIITNSVAGRQLRRLLTEAGFRGVRVEAWPIQWTRYEDFERTSFQSAGLEQVMIKRGLIETHSWNNFVEALKEQERRDSFFATATIVVASGTK